MCLTYISYLFNKWADEGERIYVTYYPNLILKINSKIKIDLSFNSVIVRYINAS